VTIASETRERRGVALGSLISPDETSKRLKIVNAALRCVAERGLRATTVEEIASEAGMARATLYRTFPGGRDAVLRAVAETETARFFASLSVALASARDLESLVVAFLSGVATRLRGSVMLRALSHERPELLHARLTFDGLDDTLALGSDFAWPFFAQWMPEDPARRAAEFVSRVAISYLLNDEPGAQLEVEADVRRLVADHVLAGVEALAR
jgi:AcrR family transcriptional regulator